MSINPKLDALETAAEKIARALTSELGIQVAFGNQPKYNATTKVLEITRFDTMKIDEVSADAWRGLLDHECAHVVHTDFSLLPQVMDNPAYTSEEKRRVHMLWNCFEDLMIEREWSIFHEGSISHFEATALYEVKEFGGYEVTNPDFVLPKAGKPMGTFGALMSTILRTGRKLMEWSEVHPTMLAFLKPHMEIVIRGSTAKTTAETLKAAMELWDKIKEPPPPEEEEPEPEEDEDEEDQPGGGAGEDEDEDGEEGDESGDPGEDGDEGEQDNDPGEGDAEEGNGTGTSDDGEPDDQEADEGEPGDEGDAAPGDAEGEEEGEAEGEGSPGEGEEEGEEGEGPPASAGTPGKDEPEPEEEAQGSVGEGGRAVVDPKLLADVQEGLFVDLTNLVAQELSAAIVGADTRSRLPYRVHPSAAEHDRWTRYKPGEKSAVSDILLKTAERTTKKLATGMATAVLASRRSLTVGGAEEGSDLDPAALVDIARKSTRRDIYQDTVRHVTKSSFVGVLVDCSGSMMHNSVDRTQCLVHGSAGTGSVCPTCGLQTVAQLYTKSHYAAVTAMALHGGLTEARVPHAVLGYRTAYGPSKYGGAPSNPRQSNGFLSWSRATWAIEMIEFIPAPGIGKDAGPLGFITGDVANADGESVLSAAKYIAKEGREYDRNIMIVIADGLPSGIDDHAIEGPYLKESVERVAQAGIEVYGLGVGIHEERVFRDYYPTKPQQGRRAPTGAVMIDNANGLTDTVIKGIVDLLTEGYGSSRKQR